MRIARQSFISGVFFQRYLNTICLVANIHYTIQAMYKNVLFYAVSHTAFPLLAFQKIRMRLYVYTCLQYIKKHFQYRHVNVFAVALFNGTLWQKLIYRTVADTH